MKYLSVLIALLVVNVASANLADQVRAYVISSGGDYTTIDFIGLAAGRTIVLHEVNGITSIERWDMEGIAAPDINDLPSAEEAAVIIRTARQASKSILHKAADKALVAVLIRGGFLPAGTTEVPAGTEATVTSSLLTAEVLDPTNATIQALSSKLARIKGIIKEQGGTPDDAIIHQ